MKPIPNIEEPQRYSESSFLDSKFVELTTNELFEIQMQYPLLKMENAEERCLVRNEVYRMLVEAAHLLPRGYKLKVLDAWRTFALQHELYALYAANITREFKLEECTNDQKRAVIRKFVSEPVYDRNVPPVHTTGGAVDVSILDPEGVELDMGTEFDAFTDKTYTSYFENKKNDTIKRNRRLLYSIMTESGFTNLPSEWWHFDYGDMFWAYYKKKPAIYKGVFTREEIYETF